VPAFGFILILIGLWVLLRTVRPTPGKKGGLVEIILGTA
jgi:hypothetical protein